MLKSSCRQHVGLNSAAVCLSGRLRPSWIHVRFGLFGLAFGFPSAMDGSAPYKTIVSWSKYGSVSSSNQVISMTRFTAEYSGIYFIKAISNSTFSPWPLDWRYYEIN